MKRFNLFIQQAALEFNMNCALNHYYQKIPEYDYQACMKLILTNRRDHIVTS